MRFRERIPCTGPRRSRPRLTGFTLLELTVSSMVAIALISGVLALFQLHTGVAKVQTQVSDTQQAARVAQYQLTRILRMAGRGGLPSLLEPAPLEDPPFAGRLLPRGAAIEIQNNVADGTEIGGEGGPEVLAGTDVLTLRGVFSTPVYQVDPIGFDLTGRTLTLNHLSPTGVPQNLGSLAEAVERAEGGEPEALVLVSPLSDDLFGVVELAGGTVVTGTVNGKPLPVRVTLNLNITGGERTDSYQALSPDGRFPPQITSVAFIGILEEYRYFVREAQTASVEGPIDSMPRLARVRFFPLTDDRHPLGSAAAQEDVVSGVLDLQVALGFDADGDGFVIEGDDAEARAVDEWLFNSPDDDLDDPDSAPGTWRWNGATSELFYIRLSTLARTPRPDTRFVSPAIVSIEDRIYDEPTQPTSEEQRLARMFRRRTLQTVIELRNM